MHKYELMVILDPTIEEKTVSPSLDKFLNVIRNAKGTIDNVDLWGRRRLAYEIAERNYTEQQLFFAGIRESGYTVARLLTTGIPSINTIV